MCEEGGGREEMQCGAAAPWRSRAVLCWAGSTQHLRSLIVLAVSYRGSGQRIKQRAKPRAEQLKHRNTRREARVKP